MALAYAWSELRRRWTRTFITALGLAIGVGLVMGIVGVSNGLADSQAKALSPLNSVGTDILVTRTVGASTAADTPTPSVSSVSPTPTRNQGGGFFGGGGGGVGGPGGGGVVGEVSQLNQADLDALVQENSTVVTDLSKLGKPGTRFTHDFFVPGTLISFPDQSIQTIAKLPGVESAVGGLSLRGQHQTGTVPEIVASVKTGGDSISTTVRPGPLSDAERNQIRDCFIKQGAGSPGGGNAGPPPIEKCLPKRFQEYQARVITPLRTIQQLVDPPKTDTATTSYSVSGVDSRVPTSGLITQAQVTSGSWFGPDPTRQVLVNTAYADKNNLKVGNSLAINGTTYSVVGVVSPTLTGNVSDLYFDLAVLQKMASKSGRINQVLVKADSAANVDQLAAQISAQLPGAQVVTASSIAGQVTGSLRDARSLTDRLGGALALIIAIGAFLIAVLLTLSSVGKRVREIGTLRAVGWTRRRVTGQIELESLGIGLLGGVLGIGLGLMVSAAITHLGPSLTATSTGVSSGSSALSNFFGQAAVPVTTDIPMTAPITPAIALLGLTVAVVGGLIAGAFGAWRAARMSPAQALGDLG